MRRHSGFSSLGFMGSVLYESLSRLMNFYCFCVDRLSKFAQIVSWCSLVTISFCGGGSFIVVKKPLYLILMYFLYHDEFIASFQVVYSAMPCTDGDRFLAWCLEREIVIDIMTCLY